MVASHLLLSIIALICFQANARVVNYDVNEDFIQAIKKLYKTVGDGVEEGLGLIRNKKGEMQARAVYENVEVLIKFRLYEESGRRDLLKLVNDHNRECINKAVTKIEGVKDIVIPNIESCLQKYVGDVDKIATQGWDSITVLLKIPHGFQAAFDSCGNNDCKLEVIADVIAEIPLSKKKIEDTTDVAVENLWGIWSFNDECVKKNEIEFLQIAVNIINDAKELCV